jgi:hypothetical protein
VGELTERGLDEVIARGCACGSDRLVFRSYVDARLPLAGGEPVGAITWAYDGEKFVDGVYEISCAACAAVVFSSLVCPRCHAAGGLSAALATPNRWPVPSACPACEGEEVRYLALVPARVAYEGKRADRARTSTELHEPGFHGYRVDCVDCGTVAELGPDAGCPLCAAPGPLRPRP